MSESNACPCCSGESYAACCEPVIKGQRAARTAAELMRSRYSAYAKGEIDWILESQSPDGRRFVNLEATREWSRKSTWKGLEIREVTQGGEADDDGYVEFKAHYHLAGEDIAHHEIAQFRREDGKWYFVDGLEVKPRPFKNVAPKIGPNEPCPCGSGKKFKKCCGKPGAVAPSA